MLDPEAVQEIQELFLEKWEPGTHGEFIMDKEYEVVVLEEAENVQGLMFTNRIEISDTSVSYTWVM